MDHYGNTGSLHRLGDIAASLQEGARASIASNLRCKPDELVFMSCGSESINTAIFGYLQANPRAGKHIVSTRTEHKATLEVLKRLACEGYRITYISVDENGCPRLDELRDAISEDTALMTFTHVNSETGAILPIDQVSSIRNQTNPRTVIHLDCVQSFGKLPICPKEMGIDFASFSGHKIHAVKGVGLLFARTGLRFSPLILGGGQQNGRRSGTESPYLSVALAKACEMASADMEASLARATISKFMLIDALSDLGISVLSPPDALPYIVNLSFPHFQSETMLHALEERDIFVSTVSACSSKQKKPSYVLLEMGVNRAIAANAVRFSFSRFTTKEEVNETCHVIHQIYDKYILK